MSATGCAHTMFMDATFSEDGRFRYSLVRRWDERLPQACFLLYHPRPGGAQERDPVDRKCEGFARRLGCGGYIVVNIFAFIAADPQALRDAGYPTGGRDNDRAIERAVRTAAASWGPVIAAWGGQARGLTRPIEVASMLKRMGYVLHALATHSDGVPANPGRLPYQRGMAPKLFRLAPQLFPKITDTGVHHEPTLR